MSAAFQTIGEPKILYARDAYLPEWTPAFGEVELDNEVRQNGKSLGFTIRQMLPERRWAVTPSGEVLEQRDFEEKYTNWMLQVVRGGRLVPISASNPYFDPKVLPIPRVERFVAMTQDYQGKEMRIGFDPNKPPEAGAVAIVAKDASGREVNPTAPNDLKVQRLTVISDLKERGIISAEAAASEMAAILLEPQAPAPIAPPPGFSAVKVVEDIPLEETITHLAKCGYAAKSKAGQMAHERNCDDCKAMLEVVEG